MEGSDGGQIGRLFPHDSTRPAARQGEQKNRSILADTKRETSRESFEAYTDQMQAIERLQQLYRSKTGKPLVKSRVVREALDMFLPLAFEAYESK